MVVTVKTAGQDNWFANATIDGYDVPLTVGEHKAFENLTIFYKGTIKITTTNDAPYKILRMVVNGEDVNIHENFYETQYDEYVSKYITI